MFYWQAVFSISKVNKTPFSTLFNVSSFPPPFNHPPNGRMRSKPTGTEPSLRARLYGACSGEVHPVGHRSILLGVRPSLGHRCRAALETRHVGTGVPASSPEDTLSWQALTLSSPVRRSLPHHPATFSVTHSAPPSRFIAVPPAVCPLEVHVPRHGTASPVIVAPSAAQVDAPRQKPMQQGPARCQQPSAFAHSGASTLTVALVSPCS